MNNKEPSKTGREILAFVHIERAAGTTLIHILRRNYFMRYVDVRPLSIESKGIFTAKDMKKTLIINPFISCIAGHSVKPYSDLTNKFPNIGYITLMRDPVKRYISHYQYWIEKKGEKLNFDEFLGIDDLSNFQVKKIAGSEDLSLAKEILTNKVFLVGFVEQFDEFLVLLKRKLYPFNFIPFYRVRNVKINKSMGQNILVKYREQIIEKNRLDIHLYNYATEEIIPKLKEWYGSHFNQDVNAFKNRNMINPPAMTKRYIDYVCRKLYYERISGFVRHINCLPSKGSY